MLFDAEECGVGHGWIQTWFKLSHSPHVKHANIFKLLHSPHVKHANIFKLLHSPHVKQQSFSNLFSIFFQSFFNLFSIFFLISTFFQSFFQTFAESNIFPILFQTCSIFLPSSHGDVPHSLVPMGKSARACSICSHTHLKFA